MSKEHSMTFEIQSLFYSSLYYFDLNLREDIENNFFI
jgi:hypothetical protein